MNSRKSSVANDNNHKAALITKMEEIEYFRRETELTIVPHEFYKEKKLPNDSKIIKNYNTIIEISQSLVTRSIFDLSDEKGSKSYQLSTEGAPHLIVLADFKYFLQQSGFSIFPESKDTARTRSHLALYCRALGDILFFPQSYPRIIAQIDALFFGKESILIPHVFNSHVTYSYLYCENNKIILIHSNRGSGSHEKPDNKDSFNSKYLFKKLNKSDDEIIAAKKTVELLMHAQTETSAKKLYDQFANIKKAGFEFQLGTALKPQKLGNCPLASLKAPLADIIEKKHYKQLTTKYRKHKFEELVVMASEYEGHVKEPDKNIFLNLLIEYIFQKTPSAIINKYKYNNSRKYNLLMEMIFELRLLPLRAKSFLYRKYIYHHLGDIFELFRKLNSHLENKNTLVLIKQIKHKYYHHFEITKSLDAIEKKLHEIHQHIYLFKHPEEMKSPVKEATAIIYKLNQLKNMLFFFKTEYSPNKIIEVKAEQLRDRVNKLIAIQKEMNLTPYSAAGTLFSPSSSTTTNDKVTKSWIAAAKRFAASR